MSTWRMHRRRSIPVVSVAVLVGALVCSAQPGSAVAARLGRWRPRAGCAGAADHPVCRRLAAS